MVEIVEIVDPGELVVAANPSQLVVDMASRIDCERLCAARSLPSQAAATRPYSTKELHQFADQLKLKKNLSKSELVRTIREAIGCA